MRRILNIAHRGACGYAPENTLEAFIKAVELGADMIEMDLHQSEDGHLIISHDYPPHRLPCSLPTLQDVISALHNKKIEFNIEIKHGFKSYPGIEERLIDILNKEKILNRCLISSFEIYAIKRIRLLNKKISLGIIFKSENYKEALKEAHRLNTDILVANKELVSLKRTEEIHRAGFKLYVYTINSSRQMQRFIQMGIDGIYTDYPDRLRLLLFELKS